MTTSLVDSAANLFTAFCNGERESLDALVKLLTPTLWHMARACGLQRSDAEDVVQAAWLQLVDKSESLREPQAVLAWLGTTVRREAWRVHKARGRDLTFQEPPEMPDVSPGPADLAVLGSTNGILHRHVSALSPRCQALLRVISRGGPPDYAALAESLGMPVGSIGPTRSRCLAKLRSALQHDPAWSTS